MSEYDSNTKHQDYRVLIHGKVTAGAIRQLLTVPKAGLMAGVSWEALRVAAKEQGR